MKKTLREIIIDTGWKFFSDGEFVYEFADDITSGAEYPNERTKIFIYDTDCRKEMRLDTILFMIDQKQEYNVFSSGEDAIDFTQKRIK